MGGSWLPAVGEEGGDAEPPEDAREAKLCLNERWNLQDQTHCSWIMLGRWLFGSRALGGLY